MGSSFFLKKKVRKRVVLGFAWHSHVSSLYSDASLKTYFQVNNAAIAKPADAGFEDMAKIEIYDYVFSVNVRR